MTFGFYSTNIGLPWGASEKLWSDAALLLQERGHAVTVSYKSWPTPPKRLTNLQARGATVSWRQRPATGPAGYVRNAAQRVLRGAGLYSAWQRTHAPDVVLLSISYHTDDVAIARVCQRQGIPFATLLHCVSPHDWITKHRMRSFRTAYLEAQRCFFVSEENRRLMEQQLAAPIPHAEVVDNPLAIRPDRLLPWPAVSEADPAWRLACVGRVHFRSKGQDLILEVLRQDRWRARAIEVTLYGEDQGNAEHVRALARRYGLEDTVRIAGFTPPEEIWQKSHALLLPSRYEGMPMVTAEALFCGRPAIVTACGRNPDLVGEGETGFLAEAATTEAVGAALERAWQQRADWKAMGRLGAERAARRYGADPAAAFAQRLEALAHEATASHAKEQVNVSV